MMNRYHGPCAARTCMFVIDWCDSPAAKAVRILAIGTGEWVTVWMCDEHYDGYRRMADRIPGLQVKF
jgi:hypothetical protein